MLGLTDEVGHDVVRPRGRVGDDEDLGGSGLGIDADDTLHGALGRGDVEIARPGDDLHGLEPEVVDTVGESADRARAAHGVDLVDAEQRRRAEDGRVHRPCELRLRRRRERDRGDAGDLSGHDVHDDARGIHGLATRHVEADTAHRLPSLHDARASCHLGDLLGRHLRSRRPPHALDRELQGRTYPGIERGLGVTQLRQADPHVRRSHVVEALGLIEQSGTAAVADILNDSVDRVDGGAHVARRSRDEGEKVGSREHAAAQIESSHHGALSLIAASLGNTRAWMRLHRP